VSSLSVDIAVKREKSLKKKERSLGGLERELSTPEHGTVVKGLRRLIRFLSSGARKDGPVEGGREVSKPSRAANGRAGKEKKWQGGVWRGGKRDHEQDHRYIVGGRTCPRWERGGRHGGSEKKSRKKGMSSAIGRRIYTKAGGGEAISQKEVVEK